MNLQTFHKRPKKKKKCQKIHFKNRFKERLGYDITDECFSYIRDNITKEGKHLYNKDNGGVYRYKIDGVDYKIVYNIATNTLITIFI